MRALAAMRALEMKCGVLDLAVDGVPIWWFQRVRVYNKLLEHLRYDSDAAAAARNAPRIANCRKLFPRKFMQMLVLAARTFRGMMEMRRQARNRRGNPVMCLSVSGVYRGAKRKGQRDLYFQPLQQRLGKDCVIVERPALTGWDLRSLFLRKDVVFFDWALLQAAAQMIPRLAMVPAISGWESFKTKCRQVSFEGISTDLVLSIVEESIHEVWRKVLIQVKASEVVLRRLKPRVVLTITSYDSAPRAMCLVARRRDVPVIELQHGLIGRSHVGYAYFLPANYQGELPLPSKILVYGEAFKKAIIEAGNAFNAGMIEVTGSPRIVRFMKRVESEGRDNIRGATRRRLGLAKGPFVVTVTTQPTTSNCLSVFLSHAIKELEDTEVVLCIKPHPSELGTWRSSYSDLLADPHVRVVLEKDVDLYELLIASDIHVTVYSTVFLESLALGTPNILVNCPGYKYAFELVNQDEVLFAETPEAFLLMVRKLAESSCFRDEVIQKGKQVAGRFFSTEGDPEVNMASAIEIALTNMKKQEAGNRS